MKPYYDEDGITIYHGDCREILPQLPKVDLVVTSPPYNTLPTVHKPSGLHAERKSGVNLWIQKSVNGYADSRPENEYQEWIVSIMELCCNVCTGLVLVNHKVRYRDGVAIHPARMFPFPIYAEVIWNRRGSMALNCKRYAPSHEIILGFGIPAYWNDELNKLMSVWDDIPPQLDRAVHQAGRYSTRSREYVPRCAPRRIYAARPLELKSKRSTARLRRSDSRKRC